MGRKCVKKRTLARLLAAWTSLLVLAGLFPAFPAAAESSYYTIYAGVRGIGSPVVPTNASKAWAGDFVYFGTPSCKYRVLNPDEKSFGGSTLLLEYNGLYGPGSFGAKTNDWSTSTIKALLNDGSDSLLETAFSPAEQAAIAASYKDDGRFPPAFEGSYLFTPLTGEKVFILDLTEIGNTAYGYYGGAGAAQSRCTYRSKSYWLRTEDGSSAVYIMSDGDVDCQTKTRTAYFCPAININRESILFCSAASGDKPAFGSAATTADTTQWKLTLSDGNTFPQVAVQGKEFDSENTLSVTAGESLVLSHPGLSGDYDHVTAALTDADGNILYYGALETDSAFASSAVTIPADLAEGVYTLSVYGEKWNGAYLTDYATQPFSCRIKVTKPCTAHQYDDGKITQDAGCTETGVKTYTCTQCGATETETISATGHSFGEWETKATASCIETGEEVRTCTVCGATETRPVEKNEHIPGTPVVENATCTKPGSSVTKCAVCGETLDSTVLPVAGHNFGEWETKTAATCTATGEEIRTCTACGATETRSIEKTGHTPGEPVVQKATCTEPGNSVIKCAICGETLDSTVLPVAGHSFGAWETKTAATCTAIGEEVRTCTACGATETQPIEKTGHTPGEPVVQKATCTEPGSSVTKCAVCGETLDSSVLPAAGHSFGEWETKIAATCTATGEEVRTCTACGATETRSIEKVEHTPGEPVVQQATCTEPGSSVTKCAVCGGILDSTVLPAAGHSFGEWKTKTAATCTATGEEVRTCTACGATETQPIEKTGHTPGEPVVQKATCTEPGSSVTKCAVCGETLDSNALPAAGHNYGAWEIKAAASCIETGEEVRTCTACGATETRPIEKNEHTPGTPVIQKATCTESGSSVTKCAVCGGILDSTVLPAAGHNFGEWETKATASCIETGEEVRTCTACGATETQPIEKTGHTPGEPVVRQATCTEPGSSVTKCAVCETVLENEFIPALGHSWGTAWTADESKHWHVCTRCGAPDEKEEHAGGTASEDAQAVCEVCGESYGGFAAHMHTLEYTAAVAPACTAAGSTAYWHCAGCGKYFSDADGNVEITLENTVDPATGHSFTHYVSNHDATCTLEGTKTAVCDRCTATDTVTDAGSALNHSWSAEWTTDGVYHWHICTRCKDINGKAAHTGGKATETELAVCAVCGTPYGSLARHTHTMQFTAAQAPTCTGAGNPAYWHCTGCGGYFADEAGEKAISEADIQLEPLRHAWAETQEYDAEGHWSVCTRCGEKTEPAAHQMGPWIEMIAAGETESGSQYAACTECAYTENAAIPPLGHTHQLTAVPAQTSTCAQSGHKAYYLCSCGKMFQDTEGLMEMTEAEVALSPLAHSFSDWETVTEASASRMGAEKRTCTVCRFTEYKDIPAMDETQPVEDEPVYTSVREPETVYLPDTAPVENYEQQKTVEPGWNEANGKIYYYNADGDLQTGWLQLDGAWFYLNPETGEQTNGWQKVGSVWYYLDEQTGVMTESGIMEIDGETYYFYDWGGMASNCWYQTEDGRWYYFRGSGAMVKSAWVLWKEKWYYCGADGVMLTDTVTPDGYRVDENGVWVP